jgi:hypothetical protein
VIPIDPEIEKLFPRGFLESELKKYPNVKEIKANHFNYSLRNSFGYFCPEEFLIVLDPSVPPSLIAASTNKKHPELNLTKEEAFPWIFFHECYHSERGAGEWSADDYSIKRILQLRSERQKFYEGIKDLVRETLKKELAR